MTAAWRIATALAAYAIVLLLGRAAVAELGTPPAAVALGVAVLIALTIAVLARKADGRGLRELGLPSPRAGWPMAVAGLLAWVLPAGAALAVAAALGIRPIAVATAGALLLVPVSLLNVLAEELVFRGYVIAVLADRVRGWTIILGQAAVYTAFGMALSGWETVPQLLGVAVGLGYVRMLTGSVWACMGFHLAFQTVTQVFAGHPLTMVVFGVVPFTVGIVLVERMVRSRSLARYAGSLSSS
ncbi:hypothetical protein EDD27_9634 [Nonomuraea polychroma]|uniref:CAAX prenyl protease 2/Lysostaphin resistance protein A-like domain-containing protein n=1 Tax=Nonomuraea polychroma TaxID=46176 RepID=A0A438MLV6_9ACTN|nr:CPBP family intramembrane glutamic endopeptidase [Nonomuraea polychroma]RVX46733.1 hypothetical protein EDD27_9634 [Nonomuraea polychroma]